MPLSHVETDGTVKMVNVSEKSETRRVAVAEGKIMMSRETWIAIRERSLKKGDALVTAQIAGIMAAKETSRLIPLCHPIALSHVSVEFEFAEDESSISCRCETESTALTGVEMEALTGCSVALLSIYDMGKAIDRSMRICDVRVTLKDGGKSGKYVG